jgi:hypothetical protein
MARWILILGVAMGFWLRGAADRAVLSGASDAAPSDVQIMDGGDPFPPFFQAR